MRPLKIETPADFEALSAADHDEFMNACKWLIDLNQEGDDDD